MEHSKRILLFSLCVLWLTACLLAQKKVIAQENSIYRNPVLHADFSDPDVIRVGTDFYMTSSSFNCVPGLPLLHSSDLVHWRIIGYALQEQEPVEVFTTPQHGNGVWAPSLRYRNGEYYIYYGDPDFGLYVLKSNRIAGPWSKPVLMKAAKGWIDPCPFWDDDGRAYLVHAWAKSRSGKKSILTLHTMNAEGTQISDDGVIIFDGTEQQPTIEGPKLYKRNGYYYIFAPAGGVKSGWQTVLRSKNIYGPYEAKIVMDQGTTSVNGPHQGSWVENESGESWFIHFQDKGAYGRITHVQPMQWNDEWPVIGVDYDGDGKGEPVMQYEIPVLQQVQSEESLQTSDEFDTSELGLQWQWHANPRSAWLSFDEKKGCLRLNAMSMPESSDNFWSLPNLLMQKFPGQSFTATTKVSVSSTGDVNTGIVIMGTDYAYLSVEQVHGSYKVIQTQCMDADKNGREEIQQTVESHSTSLYLQVIVQDSALCSFAYSNDGVSFLPIGKSFKAKAGKWIGAKIGLFCVGKENDNEKGYGEYDWFRVSLHK